MAPVEQPRGGFLRRGQRIMVTGTPTTAAISRLTRGSRRSARLFRMLAQLPELVQNA